MTKYNVNGDFAFNVFKTHDGFSQEESFKHNILIALLYKSTLTWPLMENALKTISDEGYLFGSAPYVEHEGFVLTLDKLSSITELAIFERGLTEASIVCEIGGGSGRSTDAILQMFPRLKMIYCDIPPASYIALTRLKIVFPEKKIVVVDRVADLSPLLLTIDDWDILIVSPSMLEVIPNKYVDLFIAIDCLHEFSNANREKLANTVQRVAKMFYTKNWTDTIIPYDNIPLSSNHLSGYYFPDFWDVMHFGTCLFPGNFTEILFKIPEEQD